LIRPSSRGGHHHHHDRLPFMPLLVGFLVGGIFMYLLMIPLQDFSPSSNENHHVSVQTTAAAKYNPEQLLAHHHKGWHPIHVFYGDEAGLKIKDDQKWFAQIHQDEIVIDLVGEHGYFMDLAANDAKEWSNTLALERHGWDGKYTYDTIHFPYRIAGKLMRCRLVCAMTDNPCHAMPCIQCCWNLLYSDPNFSFTTT
jgi:hypothetical protein